MGLPSQNSSAAPLCTNCLSNIIKCQYVKKNFVEGINMDLKVVICGDVNWIQVICIRVHW
jgi:hypothetical protein